ncbi:MAG: hypothetical protein VCE43_14595 [Myxococcota bacterium]
MLRLIEYAAALACMGLAVWLPGRAFVAAGIVSAPQGLSKLTQVVVGIWIWTAAIFILNALGAWNDATLKSLLLGAIILWIWARPRDQRRLRAGPSRTVSDPFVLMLNGTLIVSLAALWVHALVPGVSWDASAYHLTVPRLYNEAGGFRAVAMNVYSNWPIGTELLFSAAMLGKDYVLAKLVHFGFGVMTLGAISLACRPYRTETSAVGGALWLASPVVLFEFSIAYIDLAEAFLLTAAVVFMLRAKARPLEAPSALFLSGLCCAGVIGCKVSGIAAAGAVGVLYLPELVDSIRMGRARAGFAQFGRSFALPVAALSAPWLIKAAWYTGNPFYPFLFDSFGGPDWSGMLGARLDAWQQGLGMGRDLLDYVWLPVRVMLHTGSGAVAFGDEIGRHWLAVVPFSIAFGLRNRLVRGCLAVSGVFFVFWSLSAQNARFLIPILPLLAIAGAVTLADTLDRFAPSAKQRSIRNAVLAACTATVLWVNLDSWVDGFKYAVLYQTRLPELEQAAIDPVYDFIERDLPPDARLLMLNTNQGFFCRRPFLADSFFEASQITAWLGSQSSTDEVLSRLRIRGISHVLRFDQNWGFEYPAALLEVLDDERAAQRVYLQGRFEVFALR